MPKLICSGMQLAALAVALCVFIAGLPVIQAQEKPPEIEPSVNGAANLSWTGFQNAFQDEHDIKLSLVIPFDLK